MRTVFLLSGFLLTSCQSINPDIHMKWQVEDGNPIEYQTTMQPIEIDKRFALNGVDVLVDTTLQQKVKSDLKSLLVPSDTLVTMLTKHNKKTNGFRVKTTRIPHRGIKTENNGSWNGSIELVGDLDDYGNVESFYLNQKQRNMLVQLFSLPDRNIREGDSWTLPISLTEIGHNFVPVSTIKEIRATYDSKDYNEKGELIAKIFYVMVENVEGRFEDPYSDNVYLSRIQYTHLAYADFNVNKGRWEKYTGVSYFSTKTDKNANEQMLVYALRKS